MSYRTKSACCVTEQTDRKSPWIGSGRMQYAPTFHNEIHGDRITCIFSCGSKKRVFKIFVTLKIGLCGDAVQEVLKRAEDGFVGSCGVHGEEGSPENHGVGAKGAREGGDGRERIGRAGIHAAIVALKDGRKQVK